MEQTKPDVPKAPPREEEGAGERDPITDRWVEENKDWFYSSDRINNAMLYELAEVRRELPNLSLLQHLEEAKKRMMRRYPEAFNIKPRREAPTNVMTPGGAPHNRRGRFEGLPPDAKSAHKRAGGCRKMSNGHHTQGADEVQ